MAKRERELLNKVYVALEVALNQVDDEILNTQHHGDPKAAYPRALGSLEQKVRSVLMMIDHSLNG